MLYRKQPAGEVQWCEVVVICLKNRTFAVSQTTSISSLIVVRWLWFAWKIVLLQYRKQLDTRAIVLHGSCDLLEKSYFCSIANNALSVPPTLPAVVICLKNRTFAVSQTTLMCVDDAVEELWFAWKIVLLQYRKQLKPVVTLLADGCDLLEKSYFCSIANNAQELPEEDGALWFAWKIVLLQYRKQQQGSAHIAVERCDLLEKSYFCSIANNDYYYFL